VRRNLTRTALLLVTTVAALSAVTANTAAAAESRPARAAAVDTPWPTPKATVPELTDTPWPGGGHH
jgi:hypothetical protein